MEAVARARYIRMSPRKIRQMVDVIRGKDAQEALAILKSSPRKSSYILRKVLESAMANAENNFSMNQDALYVHRAYVDEGPIIKRFRPLGMGRGTIIKRRTSHITIIVKEREEG